MSKGNGKNSLSREDLLNISVGLEKIELERGCIWVRGMTIDEMMNPTAREQTQTGSNIVWTFVQCVTDEHGKQLFTMQDEEKIRKRFPAGLLMKVFNISWRLSGFDPKELDAMGKDLGKTRSGDLLSASPSPSTAQ